MLAYLFLYNVFFESKEKCLSKNQFFYLFKFLFLQLKFTNQIAQGKLAFYFIDSVNW